METNKSIPVDDQIKKANNKKYNSVYFFLGFVILSSVVAFIIGGIYLGREKSNKQNSATEIKEQIKISANDIPGNPNAWQSYKLPTLGIEIRLPEKLSEKYNWNEQVIPTSEKGTIFCFSNKESESAICTGEIFFAGGTSTDFSEGRGETFTDLQGFRKENGKIYIKSAGGNSFELSNTTYREIGNDNDLEIIKILGENIISEGIESPKAGTPGEGYLGAIINTKNSKYPGLSIQLKLNEEVSELEFDQILNSLKTIN